ncbi:hypothetical protein EBR37_00040 [bacterium]|nr:hypothetical protein [bacterium]
MNEIRSAPSAHRTNRPDGTTEHLDSIQDEANQQVTFSASIYTMDPNKYIASCLISCLQSCQRQTPARLKRLKFIGHPADHGYRISCLHHQQLPTQDRAE